MNKAKLITLSIITLATFNNLLNAEDFLLNNGVEISTQNSKMLLEESTKSKNNDNFSTIANFGDNEKTGDVKQNNKFTGNRFKDLKRKTKKIYSAGTDNNNTALSNVPVISNEKESAAKDNNNTARSNVKVISNQEAIALMDKFVEDYLGKLGKKLIIAKTEEEVKKLLSNSENKNNSIANKNAIILDKDTIIFDKHFVDVILYKTINKNPALKKILSNSLNYNIIMNFFKLNVREDKKLLQTIENKLLECKFNKKIWKNIVKLYEKASTVMDKELSKKKLLKSAKKVEKENKKIVPDVRVDTEFAQPVIPNDETINKNYYNDYNNFSNFNNNIYNNIFKSTNNVNRIKNNISLVDNDTKQGFIDDFKYAVQENKRLFKNNIKTNNQVKSDNNVVQSLDKYLISNNKLDINQQVYNILELLSQNNNNNIQIIPIIINNPFSEGSNFFSQVIMPFMQQNNISGQSPNTVIISEKTPNSEKQVVISYNKDNNGNVLKSISSTFTQQSSNNNVLEVFNKSSVLESGLNIVNKMSSGINIIDSLITNNLVDKVVDSLPSKSVLSSVVESFSPKSFGSGIIESDSPESMSSSGEGFFSNFMTYWTNLLADSFKKDKRTSSNVIDSRNHSCADSSSPKNLFSSVINTVKSWF